MAQPDRQALADGLVRIGEDAVAKSNDRLLDTYFTDDGGAGTGRIPHAGPNIVRLWQSHNRRRWNLRLGSRGWLWVAVDV